MGETNSFHEVRFPTDIAFNSSGGPQRKTEIITLGSGHEQRNARWRSSRRKYDVGYGVKSLDDLHRVIDFFEARRGALYGFRFRDPMDWKSCSPQQLPSLYDQVIGIGDNSETEFQIFKTYGANENRYNRTIRKINSNDFLLAVDGQVQIIDSDFELDENKGIVRFKPSNIPANNATISCGFTYDVPVRFSIDQLDINLSAFEAGEILSIPLLEILQ